MDKEYNKEKLIKVINNFNEFIDSFLKLDYRNMDSKKLLEEIKKIEKKIKINSATFYNECEVLKSNEHFNLYIGLRNFYENTYNLIFGKSNKKIFLKDMDNISIIFMIYKKVIALDLQIIILLDSEDKILIENKLNNIFLLSIHNNLVNNLYSYNFSIKNTSESMLRDIRKIVETLNIWILLKETPNYGWDIDIMIKLEENKVNKEWYENILNNRPDEYKINYNGTVYNKEEYLNELKNHINEFESEYINMKKNKNKDLINKYEIGDDDLEGIYNILKMSKEEKQRKILDLRTLLGDNTLDNNHLIIFGNLMNKRVDKDIYGYIKYILLNNCNIGYKEESINGFSEYMKENSRKSIIIEKRLEVNRVCHFNLQDVTYDSTLMHNQIIYDFIEEYFSKFNDYLLFLSE